MIRWEINNLEKKNWSTDGGRKKGRITKRKGEKSAPEQFQKVGTYMQQLQTAPALSTASEQFDSDDYERRRLEYLQLISASTQLSTQ